MAKPLVSVIVPTRNGEHRLPTLFSALERQSLPADRFEVVVVDDCSTDATVAVVDRYAPARLVRRTSHTGRAAVSNAGVAAAKADVLAFTDDDTIPHPEWLSSGLEAMRASGASLVAGRIDLIVGGRPSIPELVDLGRGYLDQAAMVREGYAATANLFAERQLVESIGGFREIWSLGGQDRDLVERGTAAGGRLLFAPDAAVEHPARDSIRELIRKEYRIALGGAELRHYSVGRARGRPHAWRSARLYVPWRHRPHMRRLRERGYVLTPGEHVRLFATQYLCLQLAQAFGSLRGEITVRRTGHQAGLDAPLDRPTT